MKQVRPPQRFHVVSFDSLGTAFFRDAALAQRMPHVVGDGPHFAHFRVEVLKCLHLKITFPVRLPSIALASKVASLDSGATNECGDASNKGANESEDGRR